MRHRAPRPLVDFWQRLPRTAARVLDSAAKPGPAQALVASVMVLSLGAGAYVVVSSVIGGSTTPRAETADLGPRPDPIVSSGHESPDLPPYETPSSPGRTPNGNSSDPGTPAIGQSEAPFPSTRVTPTPASDPGQVTRSPASGAETPSATPSEPSTTPFVTPSPPGATPPTSPWQPSATPTTPEDLTPPNTGLSADYPAGDAALFSLSATEPASFSCSLDGAAYTSCNSPALYAELDPGWHTFSVVATDAAGNVDPSPAAVRWRADMGRTADW